MLFFCAQVPIQDKIWEKIIPPKRNNLFWPPKDKKEKPPKWTFFGCLRKFQTAKRFPPEAPAIFGLNPNPTAVP